MTTPSAPDIAIPGFQTITPTAAPLRQRVILAATGFEKTGKALALDTLIPTPAGWSTMGEIQEGDEVFDEQGQVCLVVYATEVMLGHDCYRVLFSDGNSIVADADHLWQVENTIPGRRSGVYTTQELLDQGITYAGGRNHLWRIPVAAPLQLPDADLLIDPYVLGAWLGDGTSATQGFTCEDEEIIERIATVEPVVKRKSYAGKTDSYALGVRYSRKPEMIQQTLNYRLRTMNLLKNKHIPPVYLRSSYSQRLALLQGLMDTDGTIGAARGTSGCECEFSVVSAPLALGVQELVTSLGIKCTLSASPALLYGKDCGTRYRVRFHASTETPVFHLRRKADRQRAATSRVQRSKNRHIVAIEAVPSVAVRCIQVDSPSHLYLAGEGMIPTHNTDWVLRSCPLPAGYICWDPNGEAIAQKLVRETGRPIHISRMATGRKSMTQAAYAAEWDKFRAAVTAFCKLPGGTLVIDTGTELYDWCRMGLYGKLSGVMQVKYEQVNTELNDLINELYESSLSVVIPHKLTPEWSGESGNRRQTGSYKLDGWNNMPYAVQANVEMVYSPEHQAVGQHPFFVQVRNHNLRMELAGRLLSTEWFTFEMFLAMTFDRALCEAMLASMDQREGGK